MVERINKDLRVEWIQPDLQEILEKYTNMEIKMETKLETLEIESLEVLEILFDLEEKFDISIPPPAENVETVEQLNKMFVDALNLPWERERGVKYGDL